MNKNEIKIVAEIGSVHDGSFGNAIKLVDLAKECGANIVKFQMHIPEEESTRNAPSPSYFNHENRFDYFRRINFSFEEWSKLYNHAKNKKLKFMVSPFSNKALEILLKTGVDYLKVASGEVTNVPLLERIAKSKTPSVLSTGMSNWKEISNAVNVLKKGNLHFILQCSSIYPCPFNKVGINIIKELKERFKMDVGISDHSKGYLACLAALVKGATFFEKHITFSNKMYGSDAINALEPSEFKQLSKNLNDLQIIISAKINKNNISEYKSMRKIFQKSMYYNKNISEGERIVISDLSFKKPDSGISASEYKKILGKKLKKTVKKDQLIKKSDFKY